jgi:outer membrane autotransporter protein
MPYVGVRLSDNVFASTFIGVSTIAYNSNPLSNVSARFNALRFLVGGAVTGLWRDGPWRFQPTLYGTYGNEAQDGYTDSAGTFVTSQVLTYGRIGAGPEVGYTFRPSDASWSVEPFVTLKGNIDFASSNSSVLNGQSVVLRPGMLGSGSSGLGVNVNLDNGMYLRAQGSYDSIGVLGLDVWSGLLRAGMTF